jgi:hypothetical protein
MESLDYSLLSASYLSMRVACPRCQTGFIVEGVSEGHQVSCFCCGFTFAAIHAPEPPSFFSRLKTSVDAVQKTKAEPWTHICGGCGSCMEPRGSSPGSVFVELGLWLFALVLWSAYSWPWLTVGALFYSLFRHLKRKSVCRACGSVDIVPGDLPRGRALLAQYHGAKLPE